MARQLNLEEGQAIAGQVIVDGYTAYMKDLDPQREVFYSHSADELLLSYGFTEFTDEDLDFLVDLIDTATATVTIDWPTGE